ncbi:MAG: L-threonylcarbamoyladenylate synthase [Myxococcales bacterium]|nr:L-threonylcarbamoyladenylate synthase [Myxococcales bacterium]MDH3485814.1 L-threonylcarbamoyladenylate synthase [Myxococcales bacterium]
MDDIAALVEVLRRGGVVACPTETWLGLLADARDEIAIQRVAELKQRPGGLPIALLLPNVEALDEVAAEPPSVASRSLMERHWPGPLTILVKAAPSLSPQLTRDGKVGVRVPGPSPAAELVRAFGHPLTATSANRTGEPPIRSIDDLPILLREGVDALVPGLSPGGPPSTLVDATTDPMQILRAGAIEIQAAGL